MRMWNVDTGKMCTRHLLGEHVEMHMFVGALNKNKSVKGYVDTGLVETHNIEKRHGEIVKEFKKRGFNHKSPLLRYKTKVMGKVDAENNLKELARRCKECRRRIK